MEDKRFILNEKPVYLIELFAGIGAQAKCLKNLGIDYKLHKMSEWNIYSVKSYRAIHCYNQENINYAENYTHDELVGILYNMGISLDGKKPMSKEQINRKNINWLKDTYNDFKATSNLCDISKICGEDLEIKNTNLINYLLTYSFPCQDLSKAGKRLGMAEGTNTRSSLLWELKRLLNECNELPQLLLMENVDQVISGKNKTNFDKWCEFLKSKGYSNFYDCLNSKHYGTPQNRNRCYMISILGDYEYEFPSKVKLQKHLQDILEDEVDEKYYLSPKGVNYTIKREGLYTQFYINDNSFKDVAKSAITANGNANWTGNFIIDFHNTTSDECRMIGMLNSEKWNKFHDFCRRIYSPTGISPTITTITGGGQERKIIELISKRIRKLTPKECWRLMEFDDIDFKRASQYCSDAQLYKQAGNSICVKTLEYIIKPLLN